MTARPSLPEIPLTPEHARQFEQLLTTLNADEALWISGYLAAFARRPPQAEVPAAPAAGPFAAPLLILYGSETGHAEGLAGQAEALAQAAGLPVRRVDLADFRPTELRTVRHLLLLTSTHGDGEPPQNAADFCEFISSRKAPRLDGLKYAVLGLGDSSYENFCQTAKMLDQRLAALGGERLQPRLDCDVDFETPAAAWIDAALAAFGRELAAAPAPSAAPSVARAAAPRLAPQGQRTDQKHPFAATLLDSLVLNGRGSDKETRHLELSLAGSGLGWEPGDSLGVLPENDPELVAELLARLDLKGELAAPAGAAAQPLTQVLTRSCEITTLTPGFVRAYAAVADAAPLRALLAPEQTRQLRRYLGERQIIDVVSEFPVRGLGAEDFVAMLRPLQPRLYSLASSAAAYPDEAHLTVAVVRYARHGRPRRGVASCHLGERRRIDDTVPVYVAANRNFRLPADPATPLIMIGPGTGVAPFRAFLQQREATGASGRNWLFFGDRHFRTDFLYQLEWQRLLKDGRLTRMDVAFSRDQAEKVYVQHRLLEHAREIHAWLQDGANLYVCGDASRMAVDVHAALVAIFAREGGISRERAAEALRQLQRDKRYQRDVY